MTADSWKNIVIGGFIFGAVALAFWGKYSGTHPDRFNQWFYKTFEGTALPVDEEWEVLYYDLDRPIGIGVLPPEVDYDFAREELLKVASDYSEDETKSRFIIPSEHGDRIVFLTEYKGDAVIGVQFTETLAMRQAELLAKYGLF